MEDKIEQILYYQICCVSGGSDRPEMLWRVEMVDERRDKELPGVK